MVNADELSFFAQYLGVSSPPAIYTGDGFAGYDDFRMFKSSTVA